jgi:hypothetical protein
MKTLTFLVVLFVNTCSWSQDFLPAPRNKAVVYFFKTSGSGLFTTYTFHDSARVIGRFSEQNYFRYECEPGHHVLWARSANIDFVEADMESGEIYLIEVVPRMVFLHMYTAVSLQPIDWRDIHKMKKIASLMRVVPIKSWTREELDAMTKKFADPIARGSEKYHEEKAKGSTFTRLLPNMNYQKFEKFAK